MIFDMLFDMASDAVEAAVDAVGEGINFVGGVLVDTPDVPDLTDLDTGADADINPVGPTEGSHEPRFGAAGRHYSCSGTGTTWDGTKTIRCWGCGGSGIGSV